MVSSLPDKLITYKLWIDIARVSVCTECSRKGGILDDRKLGRLVNLVLDFLTGLDGRYKVIY